jgi:ferredoxin
MAKVIFTKSNAEAEVADGSSIGSVCEKQGVVFGCHVGVCGTCAVHVSEGNENLSERNDKEKDMLGDDKNLRLACQCKIKSGTVKIDF